MCMLMIGATKVAPRVHEGENLLKENKCENLLAWDLWGFSRNVIPPAKQQPRAHSSTFIKYMQLLQFLMEKKKSTFASWDGPRFESNIVPGKHLLAKRQEHNRETADRNEQICQVAARTAISRLVASLVNLGSINDFLESCLEHPVLGQEFLQPVK